MSSSFAVMQRSSMHLFALPLLPASEVQSVHFVDIVTFNLCVDGY